MPPVILATSGVDVAWVLVGVAVLCLLEDSVGLGAILPAETVVVAAAAAAANGVVALWAVFLVAWVFATAGDTVGFWIGRTWGHRLIERFGDRVGLTPQRLAQADDFVDRWGSWGVTGGRLIPAVRILVMPIAGAAGLPWRRFLVADIAGVGAWAALHVTIGYLVGRSLDQVESWSRLVALVVAAVVVGAGVALIVHRRRRGRRPGQAQVGG